MKLTQSDALREYAKMMNTLNPDEFEGILADDFSYESQYVLSALESKQEFMDYIRKKLKAVAKNNITVFAEMGTIQRRPCVILAKHEKNNIGAVVLAKVKDNRLIRLDLCCVPRPQDAIRSRDYPA